MYSGEANGYLWLEGNGVGVADIVRRCPRVLADKYLAVTAHNSAPLALSDQQQQQGWSVRDEVAYSPKLEALRDIPRGEFEEWYVFTAPARLETPEVFVNYACFTLRDAEIRTHEAHYTWSAGAIRDLADSIYEVQKRFWEYLRRTAPESYIAEGDSFIFATKNAELYALVEAAMR